MLTEVKNQIKVMFLSIKNNIMRQMINKVTFFTNIIFMILNNASFLIQWLILFSIRDNIGGYTFKEILLLWGMAASTYGVAHVFFHKAFNISELIIDGKLDAFLVQPKNILLTVISSDTSISAIGDLIYGYICLAIYGITFKNFILFTIFSITGGIILTAFTTIIESMAFWIVQADMLADTFNNITVQCATYPGSIFKEAIKIILYTAIPVGISTYLGVDVILKFDIYKVLYIILGMSIFIFLAFIIFNIGLKRYSSSNLLNSRI